MPSLPYESPAAARPSRRWSTVDTHIALLRADAAFARGIPPEDLPLAQRVVVLPRLDLEAGPFPPPPAGGAAPGTLALLLDGLAGRHVALGDRVATQVLGPGDVIDPWSPGGDALLPYTVSWSAFEPATVAVLDRRFATAAQRWPALTATAQQRLAAVGERLAVHLAICQLPRVEQRVLALLWHLAERFGRVAPEGVIVDLRLTHRLIGELVGAQRPTVSLALSSLLDDGLVVRRADGAYVLRRDSLDGLHPNGAPAPRVTSPAPLAASSTGALGERVQVLRADRAAHRTRTIAAVAHSAALRAPARSCDGDGEAA